MPPPIDPARLPVPRVVAEIVGWLIHPSDHAEYDDYVEKKLNALKRQLEGALKDAGHPVTNKATQDIAEDVNKISDKLYLILRELPGGAHIDEIQRHVADIEKKLSPSKTPGAAS